MGTRQRSRHPTLNLLHYERPEERKEGSSLVSTACDVRLFTPRSSVRSVSFPILIRTIKRLVKGRCHHSLLHISEFSARCQVVVNFAESRQSLSHVASKHLVVFCSCRCRLNALTARRERRTSRSVSNNYKI